MQYRRVGESLFLSGLLYVSRIGLVKDVRAVDARAESCGEQEYAGELAVQRVGLLRRRHEPVAQQHRHDAVDAARRRLTREVEAGVRTHRLRQHRHRLHVRFAHLWRLVPMS